MPVVQEVGVRIGKSTRVSSSRRAVIATLLVALLAACAPAGEGTTALARRGTVVSTSLGTSTTTTAPASPPSTTGAPAGGVEEVVLAAPAAPSAGVEVPAAQATGGGAPVAQVVADVADDPVPVGAPRPRRSTSVGAASSSSSGPQPTGHIEIPSIRLSHDTYEGIEMSTIDRGPSHWPDTAQPGARGNTVFPGHRTTKTRPFWDIAEIRVGDDVIFTTPAGRFTYDVTKTFVVDDEDTYIIDQTSNATFTIFACHPKGSARQRYVVQGVLVEEQRSAPPADSSPPPSTTTTTQPEDRGGIGGLLDP